MTTLPPANSIQVATIPLQAFLTREAAILASAGTGNPLAEIDFMNATVLIGDGGANGGNPQIPSISTLQSTNALVHQVWSGQIVQSVSQNDTNPNQIDILCVIPAVDSSNNEIGPFWVTEFIVTDENGVPMIAGVTLAPKLVTANGAATDLSFIVSIGFSVGTVVLQAPTAAFVSASQVEAMINSNLPDCLAPITKADTTQPNGFIHRVFGIVKASQPANASAPADAAAMGAGRPATAAEFTAGAPEAGGFAWPWPTLQQVSAALAALAASATAQVAAAVASLDAYIAAVASTIPNAATVAQTIAGAVSNVWISPSALVNALNTATLGSALLSALGAAISVLYPSGSNWFTLPGGWIVQMGTGTLPATGNTTSSQSISFITFPNYVLAANATSMGPANSIGGYVPAMGVEGLSLSGFSATGDTEWGASPTASNVFNQTCAFNWIAIGR